MDRGAIIAMGKANQAQRKAEALAETDIVKINQRLDELQATLSAIYELVHDAVKGNAALDNRLRAIE